MVLLKPRVVFTLQLNNFHLMLDSPNCWCEEAPEHLDDVLLLAGLKTGSIAL